MKSVVVTEVSEGGSVPTLKIHNHSPLPVMVPEGEILIGGKQNRVVNLTVVIRPKSDFILPVSCVEQGRWQRSSHSFTSKFHAPPTLRARKIRNIHQRRDKSQSGESVQGSVWSEVDRYLDEFSAESPTRSMSESFRSREKSLNDYQRHFRWAPHSVGFVAACNGTILGAELFDSPRRLQNVWDRISRAYIMEALTRRFDPHLPPTPPNLVKDFLSTLPSRVDRNPFPAGDGIEYKIQDQGVSGSAVFYEGKLCHLVALTMDDAD